MAFKYRQKKTLRCKRRFLKRKGAKTYRRSLTKRRSMRGSGKKQNWFVDVKYVQGGQDGPVEWRFIANDSSNIPEGTAPTKLGNKDIKNFYFGKLVELINGRLVPRAETADTFWFITKDDTTNTFLPDNLISPIIIGDKQIKSFTLSTDYENNAIDSVVTIQKDDKRVV